MILWIHKNFPASKPTNGCDVALDRFIPKKPDDYQTSTILSARRNFHSTSNNATPDIRRHDSACFDDGLATLPAGDHFRHLTRNDLDAVRLRNGRHQRRMGPSPRPTPKRRRPRRRHDTPLGLSRRNHPKLTKRTFSAATCRASSSPSKQLIKQSRQSRNPLDFPEPIRPSTIPPTSVLNFQRADQVKALRSLWIRERSAEIFSRFFERTLTIR